MLIIPSGTDWPTIEHAGSQGRNLFCVLQRSPGRLSSRGRDRCCPCPPRAMPRERFALQLFTIRRCGGHSSRPGKRSEWTSRQFSLCPKRTRSQRSAFPPPSTSPTPPWSGTPAGRLPPALEPAGGSQQGPGVRLGTAQVLQNGGVSNTEDLSVDVGDLSRPSPAAQTATRSTFAITAA